ncbi:MAG: xanthine dehydrogenase molybdopterin binding subunit, partial [Sandaracinus sp.]|nr:xanthine dehydrogenase molybdopterin binding subunit [Sandaracinus sp.]
RFAHVLHAWPVCAKVAHGKVKKLDASAALAMPGVVATIGEGDVPGEGNTGPAVLDEPMFDGVVRFYGQPVLWVLAEDESLARRAAAKVVLEVEELPAVVGIEAAIAAESYHAGPFTIHRAPEGSDVTKQLAAAPRRLSGELHVGGQEQFYLEGQCAFVYLDEAGQVMVHSSTQHPTETQAIVARVLGVPKHEVTCQALRMGGGFGGKETNASPYAAVAALGAWKTNRPVRLRLDRQRDVMITGKRHPFLGRFEVGFDDEGHVLALDAELYADGGWSLDLSKPVLQRGMFHIDNAYLVPALRVVGRVCKTNVVSHTAFRGFGGPQGMVVIEEVLDRVARATGLPPHVVRERNLYRDGDLTHYGQVVDDAERMRTMWSKLVGSSDLQQRWEAIEAFNAEHDDKKRGLAITPVKFGISFTTAFFNQAGALVLLYQDGSVQVSHGGTEMGQGLHTKMIQVAADAFGVELETIRLMPTRTDKVPNTSATAASSGTDLNGQAVREACRAIRERLAEVAGIHFRVAPGDIVFEGGKVYPIGAKDTAVDFAKIAKEAYLQRVPLFSTGYYRTPNIHFDEKAGVGKPFHYFAFGCAVTEVEVERFTGQYTVLRADILHDVGDSLSPLVDKGQVEGGYVQGVGWLTREELLWDGKSGRLTTGGASTYKLPTLGDMPLDFRVDLLEKAPQPGVIHGSKAVGEPPLMLAISAREAIRQAVSAFGDAPTEVTLACPSTPEQVYWAIERVRSGSARAESVAAEE